VTDGVYPAYMKWRRGIRFYQIFEAYLKKMVLLGRGEVTKEVMLYLV